MDEKTKEKTQAATNWL